MRRIEQKGRALNQNEEYTSMETRAVLVWDFQVSRAGGSKSSKPLVKTYDTSKMLQ
jgi:hypothetical protein